MTLKSPGSAVRIAGSPLRFEGLSKKYNDLTAVRPLDLDVRAGEFLSFLGPSGSGKTTTLMMIAGFETPTAGRLWVGDSDITKVPPAKRNIGMVFQNYALFPHMTVQQNVAFPLRMRDIPTAEQRSSVGRVLDIVGLSDLSARYPSQLSGGQQQRVALARAIVFNPPVLLMDEPLSALDKYLRSRLQIEIKRIHRELGITVIYVTHDQDEAMTMSDRICVMRDGGIAQIGEPEMLYNAPESEFVAGFLGEANLFSRRIVQANERDVVIDMGDGNLTLPVVRRPKGDELKISIRPEHLRFHPDEQGSAIVRDVTYVGDHRRYDIALTDNTALTAKIPETDATRPVAPGTRLALEWPVSHMRLFSDGKALQ